MPRKPRARSATGIYHIMLRGMDKRDIFIDNEDREKFIEQLIKAKEKAGFELYGYCLMDNHVHLLIKENEEIGTTIKRIAVGYVGWHNSKYGRTGHLFQNRYKSEPIETESYLITVLRYIHQNPVKAKMAQRVNEYGWSSFTQYELFYQRKDSCIDGEIAQSYLPTMKDFEEHMNTPNKDECLEYKPVKKYSDHELKTMISKESIHNLVEIPREERDKVIRKIYHKTSTSIRQLARVFGIGKGIVEKAVRQDR